MLMHLRLMRVRHEELELKANMGYITGSRSA